MHTAAIRQIESWLRSEGRRAPSTQTFLHELITELNRYDLQLIRSVINIRTLHPEVGAITYQWYNEDLHMDVPSGLVLRREKFQFEAARVVMNIVRRSVFETEPYRISPFHRVRFERQRVLDRLPAAEYPIYQDLVEIGATGYYARELEFTDGEYNVATFTTQKVDGFTEDDIRLLDAIVESSAACVEIFAQRLLMQTLLEIYLGEKTGQQVLQGRIQRGDIRKLESIIWFSDLRDFTKLTANEEAGVVGTLNQYFEAVAAPVRSQGGEILKFIGDAMLAIFPMQADAGDSAKAALRAAYDADEQLAALNVRRQAEGALALQHGIGLHAGVVKYGNIGSRDRLDFTVIGNAVNLASRLEGLCAQSGETILLSAELAQALPGRTRLVGSFPVKGLAGEVQAYAPTRRPA